MAEGFINGVLPKPLLQKNRTSTLYPIATELKGVHAFSKAVCLKVKNLPSIVKYIAI